MAAENSKRSAKPKGAPRGRPFPKGVSGNPGGRPKTSAEFTVLARGFSVDALKTLVLLMKSGPAPARVQAARALLDRAYGKPPQSIQVTGLEQPATTPPALTDWTEEELRAIAEGDTGAGPGGAGQEAPSGEAAPDAGTGDGGAGETSAE